MSDFNILHNPRCSKSRQTLALLEENGIQPTVIEYLKTPPSEKELSGIIKNLGVSARDILRTKEAEYKEAGLDNKELTDEQVINLMVQYPKVIERPIVFNETVAAVGRPPENVLDIIK
ncbi:arsenate reductase (glutaredoxin) [Kangiella sediminilitoris]|uniref:Arsenate reductase n=1 Tax=Kangiella sediminilitoris TaxID=1144748 RepID=A0A1B3BB97_9GAMM|nr:arsenate reductase (glutaredoxin) [Kangiella sediminilitoris]AOE50073.1 Arsenate reductase [Kangiella sediminilitoris]